MNITVISKCGLPVDVPSRSVEVVRLPNKGRCDHSYAYWIANMMDLGGYDEGVGDRGSFARVVSGHLPPW